MTKESRGLRRFSSKAVKVLVATAMGAMLVPAAAFAHYEPITSNKALLNASGHDTLNDGIEFVSNEGNTVTYMGYAHSDLAHYTMYSLYTAITYDKNGIVTGIDLTSGNDTFSGAWGYYIGKGGNPNSPIEGYLPQGVGFKGDVTEADGVRTVKPNLSGANKLGFSISKVALMSVTGNAVLSEVNPTETDADGSVGGTWDGDTTNSAVITITDDAVNLVKITYQIGQEKIYFNTYVTFDTAAENYVDYVGDTEWKDYADVLDYMASDEYAGTGTTNRNRWTGIIATVMLRELASWGTTLSMSESELDGTNEVADLDTVSGATKTSEPLINALNQAVKDGYVKGVADDVVVTVDGGTTHEINANENLMDQTTVTLNDAGQYVLSSTFPAGDTLKRNDTHGVTLNSVTLYDLSGKTVGTGDVLKLAKGNSSYEPLVTYTPESLKLNETETTGRGGATSITYSWVPKGTEAGTYATVIDNDLIKFDYENSDAPLVVTAKSDKVTHVVFEYTLGHGTIALAYDLASMKAAGDVEAAIEALDASDAAKVKQVRAAYDALPYDVHCFVSNLSKLTAAEANLPADNDNGNNNAPKVTSVIKAGVTYKVSGKVAQVTKVAKSKKSATVAKTVKIGSKTYKVSKIAAKALKGTKVTKLTIKSTTLTKAGVKNSLKGSKVKTVKVPKAKKAAYKKIFKKAVCGKKVTVK